MFRCTVDTVWYTCAPIVSNSWDVHETFDDENLVKAEEIDK